MSYGFADSIAKLIPFELGITLKDALSKEEELKRRYRAEDETRELIDMALFARRLGAQRRHARKAAS